MAGRGGGEGEKDGRECSKSLAMKLRGSWHAHLLSETVQLLFEAELLVRSPALDGSSWAALHSSVPASGRVRGRRRDSIFGGGLLVPGSAQNGGTQHALAAASPNSTAQHLSQHE